MEFLGIFIGIFIVCGMIFQSISEVKREATFNRQQDFDLAAKRYNELKNLITHLQEEIEELKK